jgi:hypothetical protein
LLVLQLGLFLLFCNCNCVASFANGFVSVSLQLSLCCIFCKWVHFGCFTLEFILQVLQNGFVLVLLQSIFLLVASNCLLSCTWLLPFVTNSLFFEPVVVGLQAKQFQICMCETGCLLAKIQMKNVSL